MECSSTTRTAALLVRLGVLLVICDLVSSSQPTFHNNPNINYPTNTNTRPKRGVPIGHIPYGTAEASQSAINEINDNERLAERSAASAVGSAVGRDYSDRLATTAQYVAQFTVPVTKEGAGRLFQTLAHHQKATDISSALASNSRAIHRAASNAASSNYDQALQAQQLGYHRPSTGYGGSGGGSSDGGGGGRGRGGGGGGGGY